MAAKEIVLDVRDLEPPEPYELATSALARLQPGEYLRVIFPRRPRLLYPWLEENGFSVETRKRNEDLYDIYIWAGDDTDATSFLAGKTLLS